MLYIIDTSAILSGKINITSDNYIFPDSVISEIRKGNLKTIIDSVDSIRIEMPENEYIEKVVTFAKKTGDYYVLSRTDIDVIALALQLNATIITDDYAIQNVAKLMGLEYSGAGIDAIKKEIKWKYRCTGCHKIYRDYIEICPICGHKTKRYIKK